MNGLTIFVLLIMVMAAMGIIAYAFRLRQIEKIEKNGTPAKVTPPAAPTLSSLPPTPVAPPMAAPPVPSVIKPTELARFYLDAQKQIIIEINGKQYRQVHDVTDASVALALKSIVDGLNTFFGSNLVNMSTPTAPTPVPVAPPPNIPQPSAPLKPTPAPPAPTAVVDTPLESNVRKLSLAEVKAMPIEKPSDNLFQQFKNWREREKRPKIVIKSVLEEIDETLQHKIANTALVPRGLKVNTATDGTALFTLDGHSYSNADDLPDPQAREFVKQAIAEWEQR